MEELKLILETVNGLGSTGAWLFVAWLVKGLLYVTIKVVGTYFIIRVAVVSLGRLFGALHEVIDNDDSKAAKRRMASLQDVV
jgi:hypothetical protein